MLVQEHSSSSFDLHGNQIAVSQKEWIHKSDLRYPGSMNFDVVEN